MKLIVGLGNPGPQYERTRHNAGFFAIDRLAKRHHEPSRPMVAKSQFSGVTIEVMISTVRCLLLKPMTYMNHSGQAIVQAVAFFKLDPVSDILVLVDDVALPTGTIRVRAGGSAGGHNGLSDIQRALGTDQYPRLRIGVDACPPMMKLEDYVLGRFTPEQEDQLEPALDKAADATAKFVKDGVTAAMNMFNAN